MSAVLGLLLPLAGGYLLGSVPTSLIIGKLFFKADIRTLGSGNAGGTNTFRQFGPAAGIVVVVVDVAKGVAAVLLAPLFAGIAPSPFSASLTSLLAGICAVVGHIWTIFGAFRGGKGVATSAGVLAAIEPISFAITAAAFALCLTTTGIVSLSSILAAVILPLVVSLRWFWFRDIPLWFPIAAWCLGALIVFAHRSNLRRLVKGEEKRFDRLRVIGKLFDRFSGKTEKRGTR